MDLHQIHARDEEINAVAASGVEAITDLTKQIEAIDISSMTKPGRGAAPAKAILEGAVAVYTGNVISGVHALSEIASAQEKQNMNDAAWKQNVQSSLANLVEDSTKLGAAQTLLTKIVEKYSAPLSPNLGEIGLFYMEAWGPLGHDDLLRLVNAGPDLENCTITVLVVGSNGEKCTNVHFVPKWAAKTTLSAVYSPGSVVLGHAVNQSTLPHALGVAVLIESPKFSTMLGYKFDAKEQDKYVAAICKDLKIIGSIGPTRGLLGANNAASLTLDGMPAIPKCEVMLTIHNGAQTTLHPFTIDSWKKGEAKSFPNLGPKLDSIDVKVTFPDTGYVYQTQLLN